MFGVPGQAIEALGHDHIEGAVAHAPLQRQEARPLAGGAGQRLVGKARDNGPAVSLGQPRADPELIVDRGGALLVVGIPRVEGDPGHGVPPPRKLLRTRSPRARAPAAPMMRTPVSTRPMPRC